MNAQVIPINLQLFVELLNAGLNSNDGWRWYYHNLYNHMSLLKKAANIVAESEEFKRINPDFLCALRSSGLPFALLVALKTNKKCLWFLEPETDSLFPKKFKQNISKKGSSIMMFDSHVVTGGTLIRHAMILGGIGAKSVTSCVLLDCDSFQGDYYRSEDFGDNLKINSIVRLSEVENYIQALQANDHKMESVFQAMKSNKGDFWRFPRDKIPPDELNQTSKDKNSVHYTPPPCLMMNFLSKF